MSLRILTNFSRSTKIKLLTNNFRPIIDPQNPHTNFAHLTRTFSTQKAIAMRFIRFQRASDSKIGIGAISEDGTSFTPIDSTGSSDLIDLIKSNVTAESLGLNSKEWQPLTDDVKLLAPIQNPEKIICIGLNYLGHCKEQNKEAPKEPMFFSKYASAITGPTGDVIAHEISSVCC